MDDPILNSGSTNRPSEFTKSRGASNRSLGTEIRPSLSELFCFCFQKPNELSEYQVLARMNVIIHVLSAGVEIYQVIQLFSLRPQLDEKPVTSLEVLTILAAGTAIGNSLLCLRLVTSVTKRLCIYSVLSSIFAIVLFIIMLGVGAEAFHNNRIEAAQNITINIIQIAVQLIPMYIMYRFWEYLTFNHDYNSSEYYDSGHDPTDLTIAAANRGSINATQSSRKSPSAV